ncbi:unnamed protein product [Caenorhabditis bovis]|uniref:Uncharacterized protein n=1 Tax=Caenorhabditis bovis TaxID=2654633 RepID=A0A8S1EP75_9PELO|nr:unnamed protein product [Caenorhabditis bovis]
MALILVIGIPGAGKSSLCRKMKAKYGDLVRVSSFDEYRAMDLDGARNSRTAREERVRFERFIFGQLENLNGIHLVEDMFHLQSMRRPFQKMCKSLALRFGIVFIEIGLDEGLRRNSRRDPNERQPVETIRKIFENFERPEQSNSLRIESYEDVESIEQLLTIVEKQKAVEKKETSRNGTPSIAQQNDVLTRKIVQQIIQESNFAINGKLLNEARRILDWNLRVMDQPEGNACQKQTRLIN